MRIALSVLCLLLLSACSTGEPVESTTMSGTNLNTAQVRCLSKGNARGTYDYDVCYRNSPEVQSWERRGRMNNLNIINKNRSTRAYQGRSYPVE